MKEIAGNLIRFIRQSHTSHLLWIGVLLLPFMIFNYSYGFESRLLRVPSFGLKFCAIFTLYAIIFSGSTIIVLDNEGRKSLRNDRFFLLLLLAAPAIFAWRWSSGLLLPLSGTDLSRFVAIIANPVIKCGVLFTVLYYLEKAGHYQHRLDGLKFRNTDLKPFLLAVLLFTPVILYFSSTPAFQETYPRLQRVQFMLNQSSRPWITAMIFELSYAFDFLFVEIFFRGFLIMAFIRYGGEKAILPMAAFYCAIHFGKPLAECISSFFGGVLLGVVSYHSRSIAGGLVLHLGIGWLMEVAGWLWS